MRRDTLPLRAAAQVAHHLQGRGIGGKDTSRPAQVHTVT